MNDLLDIKKINPTDAEVDSPLLLKVIHNKKGRSIFLNSTQSINTVAVVEFVPDGEIRGNHYHKTKLEILYIIQGKMRLYFWLPSEHEIKEVIVESGNLITIKPYLGHAFKAIEPTLALETGSISFNPDDTIFDLRVM